MIYAKDAATVCLAWENEPVVRYAKFTAECITAFCNVSGSVTAIMGDVEPRIIAGASSTLGREGSCFCSYVVFKKFHTVIFRA